jgi:hypothetical protein
LLSQESWRVEVAREYKKNIANFHGLDTFSGMPDNQEGNITFSKDSFKSNYNDVNKFLVDNKMPSSMLKLYKGLFKENATLLQSNVKKICILNIDCDIYASAKDALEIAEPLLQTGSVLLFDDYNAFCADNRKGERRALHEFKNYTKRTVEPWFSYMYSGQAFLCTN